MVRSTQFPVKSSSDMISQKASDPNDFKQYPRNLTRNRVGAANFQLYYEELHRKSAALFVAPPASYRVALWQITSEGTFLVPQIPKHPGRDKFVVFADVKAGDVKARSLSLSWHSGLDDLRSNLKVPLSAANRRNHGSDSYQACLARSSTTILYAVSYAIESQLSDKMAQRDPKKEFLESHENLRRHVQAHLLVD